VAGCDGVAFEKRLADAAAVERPARQVGTKGTADAPFARFPVLRPGSCQGSVLVFGSFFGVCRTLASHDRSNCA
jgi:hypothetical protein